MREIADNNTSTGRATNNDQGNYGFIPDDKDLSVGGEGTATDQKCKHPLCVGRAKLGGEYCQKHSPSILGSDPADIPTTITTKPTKQQLQRAIKRLEEQISELKQDNERLEAKIDALLMALDVEVGDE